MYKKRGKQLYKYKIEQMYGSLKLVTDYRKKIVVLSVVIYLNFNLNKSDLNRIENGLAKVLVP